VNALVDWVTVSFKSLKNFNCFFKYFNLNFDDFKPISGRWNYTNGLWQDGITVYYNVREDGMKYLYDMCLNFSGGGCRRYETLRGELFNWVDWFTFLLKSFGKDCIHISRTDLALDVMDDTVPDMIKIIKDVDKRKYISLFRRVVTGRGAEEWAYFGAPTSDVRLRIYNKALERGLDLKWIRFEYQFRNQGAMKYINHLVTCKNLGQAFSDYIDKSVVFTTKPNIDIQNNQKRLVPQNWWLNFTAGAKEITKYKIVKSKWGRCRASYGINSRCCIAIKSEAKNSN